MARVLSIDYGVRRTGIAVTDPLQIIAGGLTTVQTHTLFDFLKDYFQKEPVERVVVGLPRQTNGQESENYARVQGFVKKFKTLYPNTPIELWDERFTSVMAHKAILDSGIGMKARQNKALVDEVSATIILQGWMEARR